MTVVVIPWEKKILVEFFFVHFLLYEFLFLFLFFLSSFDPLWFWK